MLGRGDDARPHGPLEEELSPGAEGWLGGTYGMTDDGQFVGVVRFESREAAARNSLRPEQGAWWEEVSRCFDGEVTFHDCDDAIMMLDGGSDDAGFVQVIQGRLEDPAFRDVHVAADGRAPRGAPEIIGGTIAIDEDGWFTETMSFRSEAEARAGEAKEMPDEMAEQWNREMEQVQDMASSTCTTRGSPGGARLAARSTEPARYLAGLVCCVDARGLEPPTPTVSRWCANHLRYASVGRLGVLLEVETGFEPVYAALQAAASPLGHSTTGGG